MRGGEEGPNIRREPIREVVVMERIRFPTPEDLARFANIVAGGKPTGVYWAEGVAFIYYPLSTTTEVAANALVEEGKVYWVFLSYAPMPEYRRVVETKERIIVPVMDVSPSPLFRRVAGWLKECP